MRSSRASHASPAIEVRTELAGDRVRLAVSDNGGGFPEELMARIFEPYVTTKPRGTGLGLAIVKKIVDEHHGAVAIENRPSRRRLGERAAAARQGGLSHGARSWSSMTKSASASCCRRSSPTRATRCCSPRARRARAAARARAARPGAARHLDARHRRHHAAQGMGGERAAHHAGGDDVGPRHHRDRGRGHAHRRARFPGEADCAAAPARDGEARAAQPGDRGGAPSSRWRRSAARPALADAKKRLAQLAQSGAPLLLRGERGMRAGAVRAPARRAGRAVPRRAPSMLSQPPSELLGKAAGGILFIADLSRLGRAEQRNLEFLLRARREAPRTAGLVLAARRAHAWPRSATSIPSSRRASAS